MTRDDDLRARLARNDPMPPHLPVDPFPSPRAHELLERAMQTSETPPVEPVTPARARRGSSWGRRTALVATAAAVVAAAGVATVALSSDDDGGSQTTVTLTTPAGSSGPGGPATSNSCLMFSTDILRGMPVAFGGTVTSVSAGEVSLDVDRWYKGGDADRVVVRSPDANSSAALDGVEFTEGKRYLVTATDGMVNGCGFSGEANAELEASFAEAFGG